MNQTRIVFWLSWWVAGCSIAAGSADGGDLVRREGRYIQLTTDLTSAEEAETLVASFDAAVPQWIEFWKLSAGGLESWKVDAYVIRDKAVFERAGLIPAGVPNFPFGYALGNTVWVLAQPSEYYTRHLLLHEGAHSLAFFQFGGAGPTWFMEGTAEMMATHHGQGPSVKINQIPASRDDAPYWGRFKVMQQVREQSAVPTIETVMRYAPRLRDNVQSYGWSWAAAMMLHAYPEYRDALNAAARNGRDAGPGFNRQLHQRLAPQWPALAARWRLMCHDLDYGFDWSAEQVAISTGDPLWDGREMTLNVAAGQGWQSFGVRLPSGTTVELTASGQISLTSEPKPWISEPAGVTIEYHLGRPLGQLIACVLPNTTPGQDNLPPLEIHAVAESTTITIAQHSWLLLRINDDVGSLSDNSGNFEVVLRRN